MKNRRVSRKKKKAVSEHVCSITQEKEGSKIWGQIKTESKEYEAYVIAQKRTDT